MHWNVGRLGHWGGLVPPACAARHCRLWLRWPDDHSQYLVQHGGDPREPPSEALLPFAPERSARAFHDAIAAWVDRVHAHEEQA